jgi:hypothetical protein
VSVREGGSGGVAGVEPVAFSWHDMASTASTLIVSCCFDKGRQKGMLQEHGRRIWARRSGGATVGVAAGPC